MLNLKRITHLGKSGATLGLLVLCLVSCATPYDSAPTDLVALPSVWQTTAPAGNAKWSAFIQSPELEQLIKLALNRNPELQKKQLDVKISRAGVFQKGLQFWPSLDFRFNAARSGVVADEGSAIKNSVGLSAGLTYELNLWGQLSDEKKAAAFGYSAAEADYDAARRNIISNVASAWLNVLEGEQLVALRALRLETLTKNLAIIESGYRSGLSSALAVYLTRNDVEAERARLSQQQQALSDARRSLSVLLGNYPVNTGKSQCCDFPETGMVLVPNIPSTLLKTRPDIQAAWFRVLQQNSALGVAHKARFPSLVFSASTQKNAQMLSDLGASDIAWSAGASLIQPLISAGKLKTAETVARLTLEKIEKTYLQTVYNALQQVESAIEKQVTLADQLQFIEKSTKNALQAETLSFEQYQRGIVSYSTVLEAQRRSVDAQIQLIALKKQIIANKVILINSVNGQLDFLAASVNAN